jgi:uncharacterized membrane protein
MGPAVTAERIRLFMRLAMAALYFAAGAAHLTLPAPFLAITPDWVPFPREVIMLTGVCELAGAAALLTRRFRALAGIMLALYAVCVFPANLKHAFYDIDVAGLPTGWAYHAPRLALQPVLVWWALFAAGVVDWPFAGAIRKASGLPPPAEREQN